MKKVLKEKCAFTGKIITYTISEELNQSKGKVHAPEKLAKANEYLRNADRTFLSQFK